MPKCHSRQPSVGNLDYENEGTPVRYVISMRARSLRSALAVSAVAGILAVTFLVNGGHLSAPSINQPFAGPVVATTPLLAGGGDSWCDPPGGCRFQL